MKLTKIAAGLALSLATTFAAEAATFNIAFDITGNGPGNDAFGTFDAPEAGGLVTNFSVLFGGILFDTNYLQAFPGYEPIFDAVHKAITNTYGGVVFSTDANLNEGRPGLGVFFNNAYLYGPCLHGTCSSPADAPNGTYSISAVSAVPLPAGLPLLAGGLGAFALLRRRKR